MSSGEQSNAIAARTATYLSRMLQMNPLWASDDVIAQRSRAIGLTAAVAAPPARNSENHRAAAMKELADVRQLCWTGSPRELCDRLDRLPVEDLPDVRRAVERLKTLLKNRGKLPELTSHRHFDGDFFSTLKPVLAGAPRDTSIVREQTVAAFRNAKLRKRGRRMIALIKRQTPDLYALEADWFQSLMRQKAHAPGSAVASRASTSSEGSGSYGWLIWVVALIVIRLLARLSRNE